MQLGLYLPGLAALSGVQSLRILESHALAAVTLQPFLLIVRTRHIFTTTQTSTDVKVGFGRCDE
jgi:hypothetical protein